MEQEDDKTVQNSLIEANRLLIALEVIGQREKDPSSSNTLHDALTIYFKLSSCTRLFQLPADEVQQILAVLERLRAHLRFHGEDV